VERWRPASNVVARWVAVQREACGAPFLRSERWARIVVPALGEVLVPREVLELHEVPEQSALPE
jgi:hypothetical protein